MKYVYVINKNSNPLMPCKPANYTCKICKKKGGILVTHHLTTSKVVKGGSDMPDNLVTLHDACHKDFHAGIRQKAFRKPKTNREATIVTIILNDIIKQLKNLGFKTEVTFGNITKVNRTQLGLPKNHYNNGVAVLALNTGNVKVIQPDTYFVNKCFPKGNYRLFRGAHSHIRNQGERYMFGYQRNDIVKVNKNGEKVIGYIKGRMSSG